MKSSITLLISVLLIFAPMQVSAALIVQTFQGSKDNIVTNKDIKGDIAPETQADLFFIFWGQRLQGLKPSCIHLLEPCGMLKNLTRPLEH